MAPSATPPVTKQKVAEWAARLRRVAPPHEDARVRVMLRDHMENWADTEFNCGMYTVRLWSGLTPLEAEFCLLHEWAHILSPWDDHVLCNGDHNDVWGGWYARVYRAFHGVE